MDSSAPVSHGGRETRLLLVTIAVSIGVLLLLSRFRFPEQAAEAPSAAAAAPLERLAARAAYDELASTMADLERRLAGSVIVLPVRPQRDTGGFVVAPRLTADRAITLLRSGETLPGDTEGTSRVLLSDRGRELAIVAVPADANAVVTPRHGSPRPGPRYIVAVDGTADGLTLRPVYVGRTSTLQDARTSTPLLALSGLQHPLPRGAAIFSLEGTFIGLVVESGATTTLLPGDYLRAMAEAPPVNPEPGPTASLGLAVEPLTDSLARATSATTGVVVAAAGAGSAAAAPLPGDVIQAIDGEPVTSVDAFRALEQSRTPGQQATLSVVRKGQPKKVTVTVTDGQQSPFGGTSQSHGFAGRSVPGTGIQVFAVTPGSPAERSGLVRDDVIATADGRAVDDAEAFGATFAAAPPGTAWVLTVQRGTQHRALALEKR